MAFEDAVLLGLRQAGEQRQHFGVAQHRLVREVATQVVGRFADFAFAREKDQDVAGLAGVLPQLVDRVGEGFVDTVVARLLVWPPALLDREGAAGHGDDRRRPLGRSEVLGETLGVDGGRGDDDLQVGPARQYLAQVAQQEVDVEAAFVGLVDDDGVVGLEQRIRLGFGQQDAVGHQFHRGVAAQPVLETHLVADHVAELRVEFFGDAFGHRRGGDAARLGVADEFALAGRRVEFAAPHRQEDLGQLGGFAGTGFATHDDHLVLGQRGHDFVSPGRYGQRFGKGDL